MNVIDSVTATCSKCEMFQSLKQCERKVSARQYGQEYITLSAFDDIITTIAQCADVTPTALLQAKPFTLTYVNNIITSVSLV